MGRRYTFSALLLLSLGGCSSLRSERNVAGLEADERILLGHIVYAVDEPSSMLGESPSERKSHIVGSYEPPTEKFEGGKSLGSPEAAAFGGIFTVATQKNKPFYIYGAQTGGQTSIRFGGMLETRWRELAIPFRIKIEPGKARCIYIGTIVVTTISGEIEHRIEDRFDDLKSKLAKEVSGCFVSKQLASDLETSTGRDYLPTALPSNMPTTPPKIPTFFYKASPRVPSSGGRATKTKKPATPRGVTGLK